MLDTSTGMQPVFMLIVLALLVANALILWPGLYGPLLYDDFTNLSQLINGTAGYSEVIFGNRAGPLGRSVTMASFALNHFLAGELVVFQLKSSNLAIHLLNSVLVFYCVTLLLRTRMAPGRAALLALLVMALWMLNPVNSETVLYTIQRAALLSTTFMLAACIVYVTLRTKVLGTRAGQGSLHTSLWLLALMSFWLLALLSKENALLLPLILLVIELCFFDYLDVGRLSARKAVLAGAVLVPLIAVGGLIVYLSGIVDYSARHFSLMERLYTQPVVLLAYLKDMLFPYPIDFGIYRDDFPIQKTFWNGATLFSTCLLVVLLVIALIMLADKQLKYLSAGILIFFCGHLLESTIFSLELFFWHRNYFPAIGLFLSLVLGLNHLARGAVARGMLIFLALVYGTFLGLQSSVQARIWSDYERILIHAYESHPASQHAGLSIVGELARQGEFPAALAINAAVIKARPEAALPASIQRFYTYCERGAGIPAAEYALLDGKPNLKQPLLVSSALDNLLLSYQRQRCDFIDFHRLTSYFTDWVDQQFAAGTYSAEKLWFIDFYMIVFLLLLGEEERAMLRLERHIAQANAKASLFKAELLKDAGALYR